MIGTMVIGEVSRHRTMTQHMQPHMNLSRHVENSVVLIQSAINGITTCAPAGSCERYALVKEKDRRKTEKSRMLQMEALGPRKTSDILRAGIQRKLRRGFTSWVGVRRCNGSPPVLKEYSNDIP
jgi:hypothetical protein